MTVEQATQWYFIIGILYATINVFVRKLDTGGDYLLPIAWFLLWPIVFVGLGIQGLLRLRQN